MSQLVATAWKSASTFRGTDKRGGANGARLRLAPQKDWAANEPEELAKVLRGAGAASRTEFNAAQGGDKQGLAGGPDRAGRLRGAWRRRRRDAGHEVDGAVHAGPDGRDAGADGRAVVPGAGAERLTGSATILGARPRPAGRRSSLVDRAHLLCLTAPEMTVLVGGLRVLGANHGGSDDGRVHQPSGSP